MAVPFIPPAHGASAFNCPHCHAYANQKTGRLFHGAYGSIAQLDYGSWDVSVCAHCGRAAFWHDGLMFYPAFGNAPPPNSDLPDGILTDYREAAEILGRSPRGAAALLRLVIQKLCQHLGLPGRHLDTDIAALVQRGLLPAVQQALDAVRVVGNSAVHPGQIDLTDDPQSAATLFLLVNLIVEQLITAPKQAQAVYDSLPEGVRNAIARRDAPRAG